MIHENQEGYYAALNASNTAGESTIFVSFMLNMISEILKEITANQKEHESETGAVGRNAGRNVGRNITATPREEKILALLKNNPKMTAKQLAETLSMSVRQIERMIAELKAAGRLERIGATKNGSWQVIEI